MARALTLASVAILVAASTGCARAGGPCSSTTMGDVIIYARCEEETIVPAIQAHAQRQVSLGHRFGPFLGPWTAVRAFMDVFRSSGWSGPVMSADEAPMESGEQ